MIVIVASSSRASSIICFWSSETPHFFSAPGAYTILYYTVLYYTVLYCTILYYTVLYYTVLYCTILYYTVLYCTILYCTILYYTVLYCTILYYTVLYCTILYYIIAYCIILFPGTCRIERNQYVHMFVGFQLMCLVGAQSVLCVENVCLRNFCECEIILDMVGI